MSNHVPRWIRTLQVLYLVTTSIWFAELVFVIYAAFAASGEYRTEGITIGVILISLYGPGLIYFVIASQRLGRMDEIRAQRSAAVLRIVQRILGIPALIGAITGALPAALGIGGVVFFIPIQEWINYAPVISWLMLYVFVAAYLVAEFVNLRQAQSAKVAVALATPAPAIAPPSPSPSLSLESSSAEDRERLQPPPTPEAP